MTWTVAKIADRIKGRVEGDGRRVIRGLAGLEEAGEGDLSFLSNPRYAPLVKNTGASAVILSEEWEGDAPCTMIRVSDPDSAFTAVAELLAPAPSEHPAGIHETAVISGNAVIGADVCIGAWCVIEDGARIGDRAVLYAGCYVGRESVIGEDGLLYPHVMVRERVQIGKRAIIHSGAVLGSDGFGYLPTAKGWKKIPQIGTVEIGDDVEIGANVAVDRARFGKTVIGNDVKIDNLVQVAHNCRLGDHTAIAAQVGLAGSVSTGKLVRIGGQAGVSGHLHVGDGAVVGGKAGVTKDVSPNTFVSGFPAMAHTKTMRLQAQVARLPELRKRLKDMERRLKMLECGDDGGKDPSL